MKKNSVFISYSRKNWLFVNCLEKKLKNDEREFWIDKDIKYSEKWWEAIKQAIITSDIFIMVLTPSYVASPICNLELLYARLLNKTIIPILYRGIDQKRQEEDLAKRPPDGLTKKLIVEFNKGSLEAIAADNWITIRQLNWLPISRSKKLNDSYIALSQTLDFDLPYIKKHTQLLRRANEWEISKRNHSTLLRGDELRQANKWLLGSEGKTPEPTELQTVFITQSNVLERRRIILTALTIIGVIFLVAVWLLATQQTNAEQRLKLMAQAIGQRTIASNLYLIGSFQKSEANYEMALDLLHQLEPSDPITQWVKFATDDYRSKGVQIDDWLNNLALACAQLRDYQCAEDNLNFALAANPKNIDTYLSLADVYREHGEIDKANGLADQATALYETMNLPVQQDPYPFQLKRLKGKIKFSSAIKSGSKKDLNDALFLFTGLIGSVHPAPNDPSSGLKSPYYLELTYYIGRGNEQLGYPKLACSAWKKAEDVQISSPPTISLLWLNDWIKYINAHRNTCKT